MANEKVYSGKEVAQHNNRESCWIIVHGASSKLRSDLLFSRGRLGGMGLRHVETQIGLVLWFQLLFWSLVGLHRLS